MQFLEGCAFFRLDPKEPKDRGVDPNRLKLRQGAAKGPTRAARKRGLPALLKQGLLLIVPLRLRDAGLAQAETVLSARFEFSKPPRFSDPSN